MRVEQKFLPGFEDIPEVEIQRHAWPNPEYRNNITYSEVRSRAFTLNFRAELGIWIRKQEEEHGFDMGDVLTDYQSKLLELYLYPQKNGLWIQNQVEVLNQMGYQGNTSHFRASVESTMFRVYRRINIGSRAIEYLKPSGPVYWQLIENGVNTVDDLMDMDNDKLMKIIGSPREFAELKIAMKKFEEEWSPDVKFREELPPDQAWTRD